MRALPLVLFLALSGIVSCVSNDLDEDQTPPSACEGVETISFSEDVDPIVTSKCSLSGCHSGSVPAGRNWTNAETLKSKASEVRRRVLLPASDPSHMPVGGTLSESELQTLVCWVEQGANITN